MKTVAELNQVIEQKSTELQDAFKRARECKDGEGVTIAEEINQRNDELSALADEFKTARQMEEMEQRNEERLRSVGQVVNAPAMPNPNMRGADGANGMDRRTLGEMFVESREYRERPSTSSRATWVVDIPEVSLKEALQRAETRTTMTTAAGYAPETLRIARTELSAQRRPMVADLIPQTTITASSVKYMEETTFTNGADTVAQGAAKPEGALEFTERTSPVEKIAVLLPVTDEQLEDVPQIRDIINNRLTLMLQLKEEQQLVSGDGSTPNLNGLLNRVTQTQAKGSDPVPDAIYKAFTKVRHTGFAEPTGVIMHPNDWQDVRLLRTADGIYIWGSPADPGPERIWGKDVVITTAMTENTALTGDFQMYAQIFRRQGITIDVGYNADDFSKNKKTVRAEERLTLVVYRINAFCEVTGI